MQNIEQLLQHKQWKRDASVKAASGTRHFACLLENSLEDSALCVANPVFLTILLQCQQQLDLHLRCQLIKVAT